MIEELSPEKLRHVFDASSLPCKTTEDLSPVDDVIGQERALRALTFGLEIGEQGFNIYAAGQPGTGKTTTVATFLEDVAKDKSAPPDWCYVYNFANPGEPNAIKLPQGRAKEFKKDIGELIANVRKVLPEAFESDDYLGRRDAIVRSAQGVRDQLFGELNKMARDKGFILQSSQSGLLIVPVVEGQPLNDKEVSTLSPEKLMKITKAREELSVDLRNAMRELRKIDTKINSEVEKLNNEVAHYAIDHFVNELADKYEGVDEVGGYICAVEKEILDNLAAFLRNPNAQPASREEMAALEQFFKKYEINILVDNSDLTGAPIITELNPTYLNLFGKTEREARFGVLTTDFTMIQPGSLHKANGGYLMIPVEELLTSPLSWEGLKRALKNSEIVIEDMSQASGVISSRGLKPEPIDLKVKVVLIGSSSIYELLYTKDSDFKELFKVKAQFDTTMERNQDNIIKYVAAMSTVCGKEGLKHLDSDAISKVVEYSSRLAEDKNKLTTRFADMADIIREATFYAKKDDSQYVTGAHVKKAIEEKIYRSNLIQDKIQEMIKRGTILIGTEGEKIGQINGLTVMSYGDFRFGGPSRVTASVGVGRQGIIDVARESDLGGSIHTKGVMILDGYLNRTFAHDKPLGLTARLVFEQSYSGVDGDSASSTELYAILSVLSGVPIKQNFAVTGSVNQNGEVQAIGGVNEKIEGFFEVCRMNGLTGEQGVLIPASNVENLMLKEEVIDAVREGQFHIYAVSTIQEGIEILTDEKAGEIKEDGTFEDGTVFYKANQRLKAMAETLKEYHGYN
ncbi:MAG: ATP-binding protein [Candidatus Thorarchaeota archaeon]